MSIFNKKIYLLIFVLAILLLVFLFATSNSSICALAKEPVGAVVSPSDINMYVNTKVTVTLSHTEDIYYTWVRYSSITNNEIGQSSTEAKYLDTIEFKDDGYYEVQAYTKTGGLPDEKKIVRTAHVDKVKPSINAESIIVDIDFFKDESGIPPVKVLVSVSDNIANGVQTVSFDVESEKNFFTKVPSDPTNQKYGIEFTPRNSFNYSNASITVRDKAQNEHSIPVSQLGFLTDDILPILEDVKNELIGYSSEYYTESGANLVEETVASFKTSLFSGIFQPSQLESILRDLKDAVEGSPLIEFKLQSPLSATNIVVNATISEISDPVAIKKGSLIEIILDNVQANEIRESNVKEKAVFFSGINSPNAYTFSLTLKVNGEIYNGLQKIDLEIDFINQNAYTLKLFRDNKKSDVLEEITLSSTINKAEGTASESGDFYLVVQELQTDTSDMLSIGGKLYKKSTIGITIGVVLAVIILAIVIVIIVNKKSEK